MRLLIVTQYFRPENFRVNDLVDWMIARGHELVVLTGMPNYPSGRLMPPYSWTGPWTERSGSLTVVRVPLIPRGSGSGLRLAANYLSFALMACLIAPFRCRGRFDAIFVHEPSPITVGLPAILLRALKRAPLFFWILDLWPESLSATGAVRSSTVLRPIGALVRFIYRHCDWLLVQSRAFIEPVLQQGAAASRVLYFPNWAEPVFSAPDAASDVTVPSLPEGFKVIYAGNLGAAQDFPSVLDAAELLREHADIHWVLVGDGRQAGWIRSEIERRGIASRVHLMGSFPPGHMPAFFAKADALLVSLAPEPIFALTIPAKVQAYLAAGRPILAMLDGEGARTVVEAGAGISCAAGDGAALAAAVLRLAALEPEERAMMGRRARAYSREQFDRDGRLLELERWLGGEGLPVPGVSP